MTVFFAFFSVVDLKIAELDTANSFPATNSNTDAISHCGQVDGAEKLTVLQRYFIDKQGGRRFRTVDSFMDLQRHDWTPKPMPRINTRSNMAAAPQPARWNSPKTPPSSSKTL